MLNPIVDKNEAVYTRMCPISLMGEDKDGCPIYWEQSGEISIRFAEVADELSLDEMLTRHIRCQVDQHNNMLKVACLFGNMSSYVDARGVCYVRDVCRS